MTNLAIPSQPNLSTSPDNLTGLTPTVFQYAILHCLPSQLFRISYLFHYLVHKRFGKRAQLFGKSIGRPKGFSTENFSLIHIIYMGYQTNHTSVDSGGQNRRAW